MASTDKFTLEVFEAGDLDASELNAKIDSVWKELMNDDVAREEDRA